MSKHTPGPWLYRAKSDSVHKPPTQQPYQFGDHIFRFHDEQGPSDEDLALILAAPDLLEALTEIVPQVLETIDGEWGGSPEDGEGRHDDFVPALAKARAAIAKAEGA